MCSSLKSFPIKTLPIQQRHSLLISFKKVVGNIRECHKFIKKLTMRKHPFCSTYFSFFLSDVLVVVGTCLVLLGMGSCLILLVLGSCLILVVLGLCLVLLVIGTRIVSRSIGTGIVSRGRSKRFYFWIYFIFNNDSKIFSSFSRFSSFFF